MLNRINLKTYILLLKSMYSENNKHPLNPDSTLKLS